MIFFEQFRHLVLTRADLVLLIPMGIVGFIVSSAVPVHSRAGHYSLEVVGAIAGVGVALCVIAGLAVLF